MEGRRQLGWRGSKATAGLAVLALVAACGGDGREPAETGLVATAPPTTASAGGAVGGRTCDQGATLDEVQAAPVPGVEHDLTITSFDGTELRAHWFPTEATGGEPAPTILLGSGWAQPGATLERDLIIGFGSTPIVPLQEAGYNVLTWDPRGFGESGGQANVDSPDHEGRDVQVLLDWVAEQPEALTDAEGDPRVGMVGASYGGGIQFAVASIDCRVDALVPAIAWHSLVSSLYPAETAKSGWGNFLVEAVGTFAGEVDPHVTAAADTGLVTGVMDAEIVDWFAERGPADAVAGITAPTLIVHGTVDTLFPPSEAIANYEALRAAGTPVAMLWFCGGHGICLTGDGDADLIAERTLAWLDRHLKGDEGADVGPVVDYVDQDGARWVGDDHPEADDRLVAEGAGGVLALSEASHAGPLPLELLAGGVGGPTGAVFAAITPARADVAVELTLTADEDALVLGAPRATFTYRGTAPEGERPTRLFAQLVDDETGFVLGNQLVPVPVVLDGEEHAVEVDLEVVVHHLRAGSGVTLQLVATTPAFATPRLGGEVEIADLALELPVVGSLRPAG